MEERFKLEILDIDKFIKVNDCKEITNPVMFNKITGPTPNGLLSNEIFGITQEERSGIFAYISLKEYFIHPYYYKIWLKLDKKLRACVYETDTFIIDKNGYLVQDDNGETGLEFLRKNYKKLKFKDSKKTILLNALLDGRDKDKLFINKYIVIPPYYRDVNTNGGRIGVGEINKLYISLINGVRALDETEMLGLTFIGGTRGQIQDNLLQIYNWLTIGESVVGEQHTGAGIFKKEGLMRRSVMAKTTDNSARLVISAPKIDVNTREQLMVDMDYSAAPLSAVLVTAYPFIIYQLNRFFSNEFGGKTKYPVTNKNGELFTVDLINPLLEFSNDRFDEEINEFVHGYSNRFKPIKIPNAQGLDVKMKFKGYKISAEEYANGVRETGNVITRDMCWVDVLYICAVEALKDKTAIITRYPMDSYFNQLYTSINVYSIIDTEPMIINGQFYPWYPSFKQSDIGTDTSNKFIDTFSMANPYCDIMGADYDGDQITFKIAYSVEANKELQKYKDSKAQFITVSGNNARVATKEAIQAMYSLTVVLKNDMDKLTQNIEFA